MAKFNIEVDTEDESIKVLVDGAALPGPIRWVHVYGDENHDYCMSFSCEVSYIAENGLKHMVCADKKEYKDIEKKDIAADLSKYLKRGRLE
jgi:hypothetical protein